MGGAPCRLASGGASTGARVRRRTRLRGGARRSAGGVAIKMPNPAALPTAGAAPFRWKHPPLTATRPPLRRARRCAAPTAAPATAPCPLLRPLWEGGLWLGGRCGVRFGRWALLCPRRTLVAAVSESDAGRRLVPWSPAPPSGRLSFVLVESVHDENLDHFHTFLNVQTLLNMWWKKTHEEKAYLFVYLCSVRHVQRTPRRKRSNFTRSFVLLSPVGVVSLR